MDYMTLAVVLACLHACLLLHSGILMVLSFLQGDKGFGSLFLLYLRIVDYDSYIFIYIYHFTTVLLSISGFKI